MDTVTSYQEAIQGFFDKLSQFYSTSYQGQFASQAGGVRMHLAKFLAGEDAKRVEVGRTHTKVDRDGEILNYQISQMYACLPSITRDSLLISPTIANKKMLEALRKAGFECELVRILYPDNYNIDDPFAIQHTEELPPNEHFNDNSPWYRWKGFRLKIKIPDTLESVQKLEQAFRNIVQDFVTETVKKEGLSQAETFLQPLNECLPKSGRINLGDILDGLAKQYASKKIGVAK